MRGPQVRRALLLGVVIGVPVLFLRSMYDPFNVPKLALLFALTAAALAVRIVEFSQGASFDGLRRTWVPAAAIAAPLLLGWAFSAYRGWSIFGYYGRFQGLLPYLVVVLFGVLVADAFDGQVRSLAWAFAIAGAVVGGYGLVQRVGIDPFKWSFEGGSTIGNPNFVGGYLGMALPISLALWFAERKPALKRRLVWMGLVILAGLASSISQGGWAAGAAGSAVVLGTLYATRRPIARIGGYLVAAGAIVIVIVSVLFAIAQPNTTLLPYTVAARGQWWVSSVQMAADSPLVGFGPNGFGAESFNYRTQEDGLDFGFDFANDPHSVALSFLVAGGILGLIGFGVAMAWALRRGLEVAATGDPLGAALLGAVVAYIVQSFVSVDELSLRVGLWTVLGALGVAQLSHETRTSRKKLTANKRRDTYRKRASAPQPLRAWPIVGVATVAAVAVATWSVLFVRADMRVKRGVKLLNTGRAADGQMELERALEFRDDYEYRRGYVTALGNAAVIAGEAGAPLLDRAEEIAAYLRDFPNATAMTETGNALLTSQEFDDSLNSRALDWFELAMATDAYNPLIRVQAADALLQLDERERALTLLEPQTELVGGTHAPVWGALALVYLELGKETEAKEAMEQAFLIDPSDARALQAQEIIEGTTGS